MALGGSEFRERARKIVETTEIGKYTMGKRKLSVLELLEMIGKQKEDEQMKEYQRMIMENNKNH